MQIAFFEEKNKGLIVILYVFPHAIRPYVKKKIE